MLRMKNTKNKITIFIFQFAIDKLRVAVYYVINTLTQRYREVEWWILKEIYQYIYK